MKKQKLRALLAIPINFVLLFPLTVYANEKFSEKTGEVNKALGAFLAEISWIFNAVYAVGLATSILIFTINFFKLAKAPNHPLLRGRILQDILISGVVTALLGSIGIIYAILVYTVL